MKSKSKFTVKMPSEIYKGEVFITAFFIVLNVMYTIFGNPPHFPMYISTILFVFIPIAFSLLWIRKLKIVVSGSKITVRKILEFKYSVDVSEITKIKWIINNTRLGVNEKIIIYVNSEHFAVETLMDGFEIMSEYLLKNVDPDKIIYINKKKKNKTKKRAERVPKSARLIRLMNTTAWKKVLRMARGTIRSGRIMRSCRIMPLE